MRKLKITELNRLSISKFKSVDKLPLVVILDNIRSMHNIGSVFRTADAFRISSIYLCGITAQPPHCDIHKTALGAEESVEWVYSEDTVSVVKELKSKGYYTYAIEQAEGSTMLDDLHLPNNQSIAIVLGNEVHGVQQEVINECDACIEIPQYGTKHSLNVSVTAGIVLWDLFKKLS